MIVTLEALSKPFNPRVTFSKILVYEGGYADLPNDPGGATNHGVILATMQRAVSLGYLSRFPANHKVTKADVRSMTSDEAFICYDKLFVEPLNVRSLPHPIAEVILDFCWGSGAGLLGWLYRTAGVTSTQIYSKTNTMAQLYDIFLRLTYGRYVTYMNAKAPGYDLTVFRPGWIARCIANCGSNLTPRFRWYGKVIDSRP